MEELSLKGNEVFKDGSLLKGDGKLLFTMKVYLTPRRGFNIKQQQRRGLLLRGGSQISPHIAYKAERVQTPARRRRGGATRLAQVKARGEECRGGNQVLGVL